MGQVLLFSLTAMANPTLVAVTVVMLLLPNPKKLMRGYLLGAMMTSITVGLVIVFALKGSGVVKTTKHTINPIVDLALGAIFLLISLVLKTGEDERLKERRARRKRPKKDTGPPRWQTAIDKRGPGTAFAGDGRHHQTQIGHDHHDRARPHGQRDPDGAAGDCGDRVQYRAGLDAEGDRAVQALVHQPLAQDRRNRNRDRRAPARHQGRDRASQLTRPPRQSSVR